MLPPSEDPFLIGSAFVQGMQGDDPHYLKTIATAEEQRKHAVEHVALAPTPSPTIRTARVVRRASPPEPAGTVADVPNAAAALSGDQG